MVIYKRSCFLTKKKTHIEKNIPTSADKKYEDKKFEDVIENKAENKSMIMILFM